jgi:hypothetical protein
VDFEKRIRLKSLDNNQRGSTYLITVCTIVGGIDELIEKYLVCYMCVICVLCGEILINVLCFSDEEAYGSRLCFRVLALVK